MVPVTLGWALLLVTMACYRAHCQGQTYFQEQVEHEPLQLGEWKLPPSAALCGAVCISTVALLTV